MIRNLDRVIAIDPDVDESGVADIDISTRKIKVGNMSFASLLQYLRSVKDECESYKNVEVVVEAGYLVSSNWHLGGCRSLAQAAKIGNSTGRNHETARKIVEVARNLYGMEVVEHRPLKKCWKGMDGKITQEELEYFTGSLGTRTNQDARDAILLGWSYAGFPIRVKGRLFL
jgi:hypothetical protein